MGVVLAGGDGAHLLGSPDGVVVAFVLVLAEEVAHFHVLEEVLCLGVLVSQVDLVVTLWARLLPTARLLLLLSSLVPKRLEEVFVNLLEGVSCEEQVVVLLLQHLHHNLPLLRMIFADVLELICQLAAHLREADVFGEVVRDVVRSGRWVFRLAWSPEEVVILPSEEPGG